MPRKPPIVGPPLMPPKKSREVLRTLVETAEPLKGEPWGSEKRSKWTNTARGALERAFGLGSSLCQAFEGSKGFVMSSSDTDEDLRRQSNSMLSDMVSALQSGIEQLEWDIEEEAPTLPAAQVSNSESGVLVFICHSGKDTPLASALIELLRVGLGLSARDIRCSSVDGYRLPGGSHTETQLRREVATAKAFIGLITVDSLASAYVMFELGARWGANRHMIPVLSKVDPGYIEGPLSAINALSCCNESQLHQLLSDIAAVLGSKVQEPSGYVQYVKHMVEVCGN